MERDNTVNLPAELNLAILDLRIKQSPQQALQMIAKFTHRVQAYLHLKLTLETEISGVQKIENFLKIVDTHRELSVLCNSGLRSLDLRLDNVEGSQLAGSFTILYHLLSILPESNPL